MKKWSEMTEAEKVAATEEEAMEAQQLDIVDPVTGMVTLDSKEWHDLFRQDKPAKADGGTPA